MFINIFAKSLQTQQPQKKAVKSWQKYLKEIMYKYQPDSPKLSLNTKASLVISKASVTSETKLNLL